MGMILRYSINPAAPALDANFAAGSLSHALTFTRATADTATYFNSSGTLTVAAVDTPRYTHLPITPFTAKGLLIEESSTNEMQRSAEADNAYWTKTSTTVTANAATAPDGATASDRIVEVAATAAHSLTRTGIDVTASSTCTWSYHAKSGERTHSVINAFLSGVSDNRTWFNLGTGAVGTNGAGNTSSMVAMSNSWYRNILTRSVGAAVQIGHIPGLASADNVFSYLGVITSGLQMWGLQFEKKSFVTSYIPSVAAAATRAAESASIATSAFTFLATEGTLVVEFEVPSTAQEARIAQFDDTTANEQIAINLTSARAVQLLVTDGGVSQAAITSSTLSAATTAKVAVAYKANDFAICANGGSVGTDTGGTVPTVTRLLFGRDISDKFLNSTIKRVTYFPIRKTNAEMQALTT